MTKFKDYFNSTTIRGRANVAKATYASFAAVYFYTRFARNKKKSKEAENTNADFKEPQVSAGLQHLTTPSCECHKDKQKNDFSDEEYTKEYEFHESMPTAASSSVRPRTHSSHVGDSATFSESTVNSKSYYGGKQFESKADDFHKDSPLADKGLCQKGNRY